MPLRLSKVQAKQYGLTPPTRRALSAREQYGGYRSGLEQEFAAYLAQAEGHVWRRIVYEPWQFVLVHGLKPVRYTPDFLCIPNDETLRESHPLRWGVLFEVKGYWRPKDRVIVKLCAERYPEFRMVGVQKKHGVWEYEYFN